MQPPPYTAPSAPTEFKINYVQPPPPMVVTIQPTVVVMAPPVYKDYLAWSIVNMICCSLLLGIVALIFSIQTRDANHRYDSLTASSRSRLAFIWNMAATVVGLCFNIAWIGSIIYFSVT